MLDFTAFCMAYLSNVHWAVFVSLWHTNNPSLWVALWCVTIHRQQLTLPENDNRQQAYSPATASSLCVYLCDRSGQRGQVWLSARLSQSKRDRTEQAIFSNPLWLNSLFSHQSLWNCSVSLYERHPDGTVGSKASERRGRSRGWGTSGEVWVNKLNVRPQRRSW